jgi:hypothetical protein
MDVALHADVLPTHAVRCMRATALAALLLHGDGRALVPPCLQ